MKLALSTILVAAAVGNAAAQPETPAPAGEPSRLASVTFSPVHLQFPIVEINAEFNVAPHTGLAVIGALGKISDSMSNISGTATEVGGQFNYYPLRKFAGLHGGFEVLYLRISDVNVDTTVSGAGLSAGPYIGYKGMLPLGLTFVAQLGVDFIAVEAKSSTATMKDRKVFPLLNLNVGWSF
jgi:hypothetical protein